MAQINQYLTSASYVVKPKSGYAAMFIDENKTIKLKDDQGTVMGSVLSADTASYAVSSSYTADALLASGNTVIYRATSTTSANGVVSFAQQFNNTYSGFVTVTNNQEFVVARTSKIDWYIGYVPANSYYTMTLQYYSSGTWQTFRGDLSYATVATGGSTNFGGGTYATDYISANTRFRLLAGSSGLPVGVGLVLTRLG